MIIAGILAAGNGKRFGGNTPKQFQILHGKPMLYYSIKVFLECSYINSIFVALPQKHIKEAKKIIEKNFSTQERTKIFTIIGGTNRTLSLLNICKEIVTKNIANEKCILISHDADRPLITKDLITNCIMDYGLKKCPVLTAALPTTDTIYNSNSNTLLLRENLYNIQTPQIFKIWDYWETYYTLFKKDITSDFPIANESAQICITNKLTDATSVFLLAHKQIALSLGDEENIKITHPVDMKLANLILHERSLIE